MARRYRYKPGFSRAQARFVLAFGLPLAGANLLNFILLNADYAFVGRLLGPSRLGIYMLAFNAASWSTSLLGWQSIARCSFISKTPTGSTRRRANCLM